MAMTSKLCWIKVARVGIFVLILILEEMLSAFHHLVGRGYGKYSYSGHHFAIYRNIDNKARVYKMFV